MIAQLRLRGVSIRSLANRIGVRPQAVSAALVQPSARCERALADALGMRPRDLFPERYDPISGERTAKSNPSGARRRRNVEDREVA